MTFLNRLTRPRLPRAAFVLDAAELAAVEVRRRGDRFVIGAASRAPLAPGLLVPSFDQPNIPNLGELASVVDGTARAAGLGRRQRWSILLPEQSVKSLVVMFDSVPASRDELREMVGWKVERMVGVPASELRIARQFVGSGRMPRFLAVAMRNSVAAQYDELIATLGWNAGLIVPRFVGEAAWFDWDSVPGDKLAIGSRGATCQASFVRDGELLLVRSLDGDPAKLGDEVYRLMLYYRDRIAEAPERAAISSILTCGAIDGERVSSSVAEALGTRPGVVRPVPDLIDDVEGSTLAPALVAAAGLATQAWSS